MKIKQLKVINYRLLKEVTLSLSERSTLIVGRNNTGKTSLTEIFRSFISDRSKLRYEDFNMSALAEFATAQTAYADGQKGQEVRKLIPSVELRGEIVLSKTAGVGGLMQKGSTF